MRFRIIYLDGEGFSSYAEQIETRSFRTALIFAAERLKRQNTEQIAGYFISHADSEFMRRFQGKPGGPRQTRAERFDSELLRDEFPHLYKPS